LIPLAKPNINYEQLGLDLERIIKSGWWTMGKVTEQFEGEFAKYVGTKYAIATSSCSMALIMAIRAGLDKKRCSGSPNDRIITTPLTFVSTINAIIFNGLQPFLVDIRKETLNIDEEKVCDIVNEGGNKYSRCVGIVPVHFGGNPCNMDIINSLGDLVFVIQDCAHAVEAKWHGRRVGTYDDCSCFSLGPIKNIATPDMGVITTNDEGIAQQIRNWRCHGMSSDSFKRVSDHGQYDIADLGYKAHPTDISASFALQELKNVRENWFRREEIVFEYNLFFHKMYDEGLFNGRVFPNYDAKFTEDLSQGNIHAFHLFQVTLNNRDDFIARMKNKDVYCGIHYKPIHLHSYYARRFDWKRGHYPNAEWIGDHIVSLPLGPGMTSEDVAKVLECCEELLITRDYLL